METSWAFSHRAGKDRLEEKRQTEECLGPQIPPQLSDSFRTHASTQVPTGECSNCCPLIEVSEPREAISLCQEEDILCCDQAWMARITDLSDGDSLALSGLSKLHGSEHFVWLSSVAELR